MTDAELLALAVQMRQAQVDYYRNGRTQAQLARARGLEGMFDRAVARRAEAQRTLFGDDDADPPVIAPQPIR